MKLSLLIIFFHRYYMVMTYLRKKSRLELLLDIISFETIWHYINQLK